VRDEASGRGDDRRVDAGPEGGAVVWQGPEGGAVVWHGRIEGSVAGRRGGAILAAVGGKEERGEGGEPEEALAKAHDAEGFAAGMALSTACGATITG
jgi:hypothetical protein